MLTANAQSQVSLGHDASFLTIDQNKITYFPESLDIFNPHYLNQDKTRIRAIVRNLSGHLTEMEADCADLGSPFLRDVLAQFTPAEIELNTHKENIRREKRSERDRIQAEDKAISEEREAVFRAKSQALEIPEIKSTTEVELVRRLRKSRTVTEVNALASLILMRAWQAQTIQAKS